MTPDANQQRRNHTGWGHWKRWSRGEKIRTVVVVLVVLAGHVFFNYLLPGLAEKERKAGSAGSGAAPNLRIPRPEVSIPPNPNGRP